MAVLIVLLGAVGAIIWGAVTEQRIGLVETQAFANLDLESPAEVGGLTVNIVEHRGGPIPVLFLHGADIAGGVVFDGAISHLPARFMGLTADLPGFGLSQRLTEPGPPHTVAMQAAVVADVLQDRLSIPAVLVGVGFGGEVAAEVTVTHPELVRGLVLVDVDFWEEATWRAVLEQFPFLGRPVTFTFETGGVLGLQRWAPQCAEGGWCPTGDQEEARKLATTIEGSTDSFHAHLLTLPSSLVPSDLPAITVPVAYVWSKKGPVPAESVERVRAALPGMALIESDTWRAHLEAPETIGEAVEVVSP